MTTKTIPETHEKDYDAQKAILKRYGYSVPTILNLYWGALWVAKCENDNLDDNPISRCKDRSLKSKGDRGLFIDPRSYNFPTYFQFASSDLKSLGNQPIGMIGWKIFPLDTDTPSSSEASSSHA